MLFNVPNLITYGRIVLIPVVAVLIMLMEPRRGVEYNGVISLVAMVIFAASGISDVVDGYYARKYGAVSLMGKFIDPMADKLSHMTAMVLLIPLGRIAAWLVAVLLFREIFISGIRAVAAGEGLIIDAAAWGKKKTVWLNCGISGLIYYYPMFPGTPIELNAHVAGMICMYIALVYSLASAFVYTKEFFRVVRR